MAAAYGKMLSLTAGPAIPGAWRQWLALAVANGTTGSVKEIACGGLTGGRPGKFTPSCRSVLKKQFRNGCNSQKWVIARWGKHYPPHFFCKYSTCFFLLSLYGMLNRIYTRSYDDGDGKTTRFGKGTGEAVWSGARIDCPYDAQVRARAMRMRERQAASVLLPVAVFSWFEKQDPVCEAVRGKSV